MGSELLDKITVSPLARSMVEDCAEILKTAPDPWSAQAIENTLGNLNQWGFVALLDERPVAFANFLVLAESADLQQLAVREDMRRKGIGRHLLAHSLAELGRNGATHCLLEVRASNRAAVALYEAVGFIRVAVRPGMYRNPMEDGFLMGFGLGQSRKNAKQ